MRSRRRRCLAPERAAALRHPRLPSSSFPPPFLVIPAKAGIQGFPPSSPRTLLTLDENRGRTEEGKDAGDEQQGGNVAIQVADVLGTGDGLDRHDETMNDA